MEIEPKNPPEVERWTAQDYIEGRCTSGKVGLPRPSAADVPAELSTPVAADLQRVLDDLQRVLDDPRAELFDSRLLRAAFEAAGGPAGFLAWAAAHRDEVFKLATSIARDAARVDRQAAKPAQRVQLTVLTGISSAMIEIDAGAVAALPSAPAQVLPETGGDPAQALHTAD